MERQGAVVPDQGAALIALYDTSLSEIYGYLLRRCGDHTSAEELTAETFLAAVTSVRSSTAPELSVGWLVGIARHKLVDYWRRRDRDRRLLSTVAAGTSETEDPWDAELDVLRAEAVLGGLSPQHRLALSLRYLDDLSVPDVALELERTVHATEALLVRARRAFRRSYERSADDA